MPTLLILPLLKEKIVERLQQADHQQYYANRFADVGV
jgi:hypothetical protein